MHLQPVYARLLLEHLNDGVRIFLHATRPYDFDSPPEGGKGHGTGRIACPVSFDLAAPELDIRFGRPTTGAIVPMPETPVHEDRRPMSR